MYKEEFDFFQGYDFHHIGYASKSIEKELKIFKLMGFYIEGDFFEDYLQGIRGCFIKGNGPRIELLENLPNSNQLSGLINRGISMYHLAYKVNSIDNSIKELLTKGSKIILNPTPSVAFSGKKIAFVLFKNGLIIELIQK